MLSFYFNSINRKLVSVRSLFKFLVKRGDAPKNPVSKLTNLKTKKRLPQFIREGDMNLILDDVNFTVQKGEFVYLVVLINITQKAE